AGRIDSASIADLPYDESSAVTRDRGVTAIGAEGERVERDLGFLDANAFAALPDAERLILRHRQQLILDEGEAGDALLVTGQLLRRFAGRPFAGEIPEGDGPAAGGRQQ